MKNQFIINNKLSSVLDLENASVEEVKLILLYLNFPLIEVINNFEASYERLVEIINKEKFHDKLNELKHLSLSYRKFKDINKKEMAFITKSLRRINIFIKIMNSRDIKVYISDLFPHDFINNGKHVFDKIIFKLNIINLNVNDADIKEKISILLCLLCLIKMDKRIKIFKLISTVTRELEKLSESNKSIFNLKNSVQKLRIANNYFSRKDGSEFGIDFPNLEHLLIRLDNSYFSYGRESWLKDITEIRNRYSTWNTRQKADKQQVNLTLSKKALDILELIAKKRNSTKSLVVQDFLLNYKDFDYVKGI